MIKNYDAIMTFYFAIYTAVFHKFKLKVL